MLIFDLSLLLKGCFACCCGNFYLIELGMLHNESYCTMCCCSGLSFTALRTKIRTERNIEIKNNK
jgi:hypothetical protein